MKHLSRIFFAAGLLTAVSAAHGQTVFYGTNFDGTATSPYNDAGTYVANESLSAGTTNNTAIGGTVDVFAGQNGWLTNDATQTNTATASAGYQNEVVNGSSIFAGNAGVLAGGYTGPGYTAYAGTNPVYLYHAFTTPLAAGGTTLAQYGYVLNTDFAITSSANALNNTYGFTFQSTLGGTNLFSINMAPDPAHLNVRDGFTSTNGGVTSGLSVNGFSLNSLVHLTVSVSPAGQVTATFSQSGVSQQVASFTLAGGNAAALSVMDVAVTETNATAGTPSATNSGQDQITFDNFSVAVPEPSTYLLIGLSLIGMVAMMKVRRSA